MLGGDEVQGQRADRRSSFKSVLPASGDHVSLQVVRGNPGDTGLKPK